MNLGFAGDTSTATLQFPEIAATTTGATQDLLGGDVLIYSRWPLDPVRRIVILEQTLGDNWDGYGSGPIPRGTANTAIALLNDIAWLGFEDLPAPSIGPMPGGGLSLEWSVGRRDLNLSVFPDRSVEYMKAEAGEPFDEGRVVPGFPDRFRELISWFLAP
jgi:hypothetical protein